jgi:LacI family transcriptional regulator
VTTPDTPGLRRRVLLRDVAAAAKVSDSTASRALADDPRISVATRQAVKAAAAELQYVPNAAARSLRMRHTSTLGLLIPNLDDPIHGQIAAGFEEEASRNGYCVIMVAGDDVPARERLALHVFAEHGADAVAIVSSAISPREGRERVDPARLVIVQPDHRTLPRHAGPVTPGVIMTDDAAGVRSAVEHLLDCGYRRIAYVEGEGGPSNALREATVAAAIRGRGTRATTRTFHADDDAWRAPAALAAEIAADPPEALVCYDDKLALALMDALRALGIRIPGDIAMIGFDGIPFTAISNPRLTTVVTPAGDMGRLAAASLIRAIREGTPPEGHILEPELIVRESTSARPRAVAAVATDEPPVARRSVRAGR